MIESLTRANLKCPEMVSLIDVILNTVPHKYTSVFANDTSDHCAVVRNTKFQKTKPKAIKSLAGNKIIISNEAEIFHCFKKHFTASGSRFDTQPHS